MQPMKVFICTSTTSRMSSNIQESISKTKIKITFKEHNNNNLTELNSIPVTGWLHHTMKNVRNVMNVAL